MQNCDFCLLYCLNLVGEGETLEDLCVLMAYLEIIRHVRMEPLGVLGANLIILYFLYQVLFLFSFLQQGVHDSG